MSKAQDKRAMLAAQEKFMASFSDTEECTRSALRGWLAGWKAARREDTERDQLRAALAAREAEVGRLRAALKECDSMAGDCYEVQAIVLAALADHTP